MKTKYIKASKIFSCIAAITVIAAFNGCKKSIDIGPSKTLLNTSNVYNSNSTAESVVAGLFASMASNSHMYNGLSGVALQQGLAADELQNLATQANVTSLFYANALTSQNNYYWLEIYSELFTCNSAIAGIAGSTALTPSIQQQLLGEVKFLRAFIFFNAVNLYGNVPLALSTDPNVNDVITRSPAADVLKQVVQDLTDAQSLLPDNSYITFAGTPSTSRILPNKQTANALLARVYLYMQDWKDAEAQATNVISASTYILEPVLNNVFLITSRETIWELQSTDINYGNTDGYEFIMTAPPNGLVNNYPLSNSLVSQFEPGDKRFSNWVGQLQSGTVTYYYAYKYKQGALTTGTAINEYPIMFRLGEQYLIRAEARAQQGNIGGAQTDLDAIRTRAGLSNTTAATQADLLTAVYHERQIELFTEFGHRWFDLKRTGRLDAVMSVVTPQKGGTWSSYKALVPLPQTELLINPHLTQNPGY